MYKRLLSSPFFAHTGAYHTDLALYLEIVPYLAHLDLSHSFPQLRVLQLCG